jgi:hypothetical protein
MKRLNKIRNNIKREWVTVFCVLVFLVSIIYADQLFGMESPSGPQEILIEEQPSYKLQWSAYSPLFSMGAWYYMRWQINERGEAKGFKEGSAGHIETYCNGEVRFDGRSDDGGYLYSCYPN